MIRPRSELTLETWNLHALSLSGHHCRYEHCVCISGTSVGKGHTGIFTNVSCFFFCFSFWPACESGRFSDCCALFVFGLALFHLLYIGLICNKYIVSISGKETNKETGN